MTIQELKNHEGEVVEYFFRGKWRKYLLAAVQSEEPCGCKEVSEEHRRKHLIHGIYQGRKGDFRLNKIGPIKYASHDGTWVNKIERIRLIQS